MVRLGAGGDIFTSTHIGLSVFRRLTVRGQPKVIANNEAAGLPNFAGTQCGLITRIATRAYEGHVRCHTRGILFGLG